MPKSTRTQLDPRYGVVNKTAVKRSRFCKNAGWRWLMQNHPEVVMAIQEEAYQRWPKVPRKSVESPDYSFLAKVTERNSH